MAVFAMCASRLGAGFRLAHIAKSAMYAPPQVSDGDLGRDWVAHTWRCLPMCASRWVLGSGVAVRVERVKDEG